MQRLKSKKSIIVLFAITLLFLSLTVFLLMGITFGRYQTRSDYNIGFNVNPPSHLYIYEQEIQDDMNSDNENVKYKDFDNTLDWISDTDDQSAHVFFSNSGITDGGSENILTANENISFKIRLFVADDLSARDSIASFNVTLNVDGVEYKVNNYYMSSFAPMAKEDSLGRGWIYYFVDKNGNEAVFNIKGKQENKIEAVFKVLHVVETDTEGKQNYVNVDVSPLKLVVDRVSP